MILLFLPHYQTPFLLFQRNYPSPILSTTEPTEESISTLVSMGFDRNSARQALVQARNDVNVATNILLEAQAHWFITCTSVKMNLKCFDWEMEIQFYHRVAKIQRTEIDDMLSEMHESFAVPFSMVSVLYLFLSSFVFPCSYIVRDVFCMSKNVGGLELFTWYQKHEHLVERKLEMYSCNYCIRAVKHLERSVLLMTFCSILFLLIKRPVVFRGIL